MNIINKKIEDIIPYEKNPRRNDEAVPYVINSIKEFGFKVPIIIDKENIVICGHTRLKAAIQLNMEEIPCIVADDLTDEQVKAFRLADNKVGEISEWDFNLLSEELEKILDIDMSNFDFNEGLDDFDFNDEDFIKNEKRNEKKPEIIVCPHCGKEFEK